MTCRALFSLPSLAFLTLFALSCSYIGLRDAPPAVKATVVRVTGDYLTHVAYGRARQLTTMVDWDSLLQRGTSSGISREEFYKQLEALKNRWSVDENPLLDLEVLEVEARGDRARVTLRKRSKSDYPVIWVKLLWSGSGWIISEDSIFGRNKLASRVLAGLPLQ